jgi:hypothetical protein
LLLIHRVIEGASACDARKIAWGVRNRSRSWFALRVPKPGMRRSASQWSSSSFVSGDLVGGGATTAVSLCVVLERPAISLGSEADRPFASDCSGSN